MERERRKIVTNKNISNKILTPCKDETKLTTKVHLSQRFGAMEIEKTNKEMVLIIQWLRTFASVQLFKKHKKKRTNLKMTQTFKNQSNRSIFPRPGKKMGQSFGLTKVIL